MKSKTNSKIGNIYVSNKYVKDEIESKSKCLIYYNLLGISINGTNKGQLIWK